MESKVGIKETKEALSGILELSLALTELLKDGAQVTDLSGLFLKFQTDANFKAKLQAAVDKASSVPAEMKDLDMKEGIEIATDVLLFVPKFVDAFSKKA